MTCRRLFLTLIFFAAVSLSSAQIRLPRLVSDGMVLQCGTATRIWGDASPGEDVKISFIDSVYLVKTDANGKWQVKLDIPAAGGPYQMKLEGRNEILLNNILVGEVWVSSGQSNMDLTMERASPLYPDIIKNSENSKIRYFEVPDRYNFKQPQEDLEGGSWMSASPETILRFSAVSYFFAKELNEKYGVPVGIINASLGGSPAEAWMSESSLEAFPEHLKEMQRFKSDSLIAAITAYDRANSKSWHQALRAGDEGFRDPEKPWFLPGLNDRKWNEFTVPGYWSDSYPEWQNGVFWFRKEFVLPAEPAGQDAMLLLGRIIDSDSVYLNGVFVGTTSYRYPPRRYPLPDGLLKAGKNTLTVRVISSGGKGGFVPDKDYKITTAAGEIDLSGRWKINAGALMEAMKGSTTIRFKPGGLYNAMIAPLLDYSIRGVIWYQGEANTSRYAEYATLFPAMIGCWRTGWQNTDLPFLYVQLPNYMEATPEPEFSSWAFLREAQTAALKLPNTAMAVAIDLGEWNDIHPLNKKDVGHRLALKAREMVYGENGLLTGGPEYSSVEFRGDTAVVSFSNLGKGLVTQGQTEPGGFSLAGKDGRFYRANARLDGDEVLVWSGKVCQPVAVRYAWDDNPDTANLFNTEGLPVAPFRTDMLGR